MTQRRLYVRYRSTTSPTGVMRAILFSGARGEFPPVAGLLFKAEIKPEYFDRSLDEISKFFDNPKPRIGVRHD